MGLVVEAIKELNIKLDCISKEHEQQGTK